MTSHPCDDRRAPNFLTCCYLPAVAGLRVIDAVVESPVMYLLECGSVCSNSCVRYEHSKFRHKSVNGSNQRDKVLVSTSLVTTCPKIRPVWSLAASSGRSWGWGGDVTAVLSTMVRIPKTPRLAPGTRH